MMPGAGWRIDGHADVVGIDFLHRNAQRKASFPLGVSAQSVHIVSRCEPMIAHPAPGCEN